MNRINLKSVSPSHPLETISKGISLISPYTGVVQEIVMSSRLVDDPMVFSFGIRACNTTRFYQHLYEGRSGGAGCSEEEALAATIGEVIERYCSIFYNKKVCLFASYKDISSDAVNPNSFASFSDKQYERENFPFVRFTEESRTYWVKGYSLTTGQEKWLPCPLVYLAYQYEPQEDFIGHSTSTGLSAGNTLEEAILGGIYEVVERDAFMIFWLNKLSMPCITLEDELKELFEERFNVGIGEWYMLDISSDIGIPTFLSVNIGKRDFGQYVAVGTASRLNPKDAVRKTLIEVGQTGPYFRYEVQQYKDWQPENDFSNVTNFSHHAIFYIKRPDLINPAFEFIRGNKEQDFLNRIDKNGDGSILGNIQTCVKRLREKGYEVIVTDVTTREIKDMGLYVVKVLIPGLVPLHGDHRFPFLGTKRLYEVPAVLGYKKNEMNSFPHPFP